ncbi:MAG: 2-hydroxyacid dehydrogenase [Rhizobiaceae bacterium]
MSGKAHDRVLLSATGMDVADWLPILTERRETVTEPDGAGDPTITYAVVWKQPEGILAALPNLKAIFSIGAGVDHVLSDQTLPANVPIVRVVNDNLSQHMIEYVVWRVLDHHRQATEYREQQSARIWQPLPQVTSDEVTVGIMGFGALGEAVGEKLVAIGFSVHGWSRNPRHHEQVVCHAGSGGLENFLAATDILVVLLPLTEGTAGIVSYELLSGLKKDGPLGGPVLINAGRGGLQNEADILRALNEGMLKEASLDVFETEPLPKTSPLWVHPRIFLTPHAAAESDPKFLIPPMLDQMDAHDRGEPLKNLVDRNAGY